MKNIFKRATALMLSLLMVFSVCSTSLVVYANEQAEKAFLDELWASLLKGTGTENPDKPLVYVSIGDSMTNGYGLEGYEGQSGLMNYGINTYANKFAAWLAGYNGEIENDQVIFTGTKGTVDHRQLAFSGMRAEDLHWLLDLDYKKTDLMIRLAQSWVERDKAFDAVFDWEEDAWAGDASKKDIRDYWYMSLEDSEYALGQTAGDQRTWYEVTDPSAGRLGDGVAKMLYTYYATNSDANGYFVSDYATEKMINECIAGVEDDATAASDHDFFPGNGTEEKNTFYSTNWLQVAGEFYQESVAAADVVSLSLGNTNFGTWMFDWMQDVFGADPSLTFEQLCSKLTFYADNQFEHVYKVANFDEGMQAEVEKLMAKMDPLIDQYLSEGVSDGQKEYLAYLLKYCVLSYIVNYIGSVDRIVALNNDVDLIQIALINAYDTGSEYEGEGMSMAEIIDMLYVPLNAFIAALPTYMQSQGKWQSATFYYVDAGHVQTLSEVFGNDFYTYDGDAITYDQYQDMLADGSIDLSKLTCRDSVIRNRMQYWLAATRGCYENRSHANGAENCDKCKGYPTYYYLWLEMGYDRSVGKGTSWGWCDVLEYGEILKGVLGNLECDFPDDLTLAPSNTSSPYYQDYQIWLAAKNAGSDMSDTKFIKKFFNEYRITYITEADVKAFEKMSRDDQNNLLNGEHSYERDKAFTCAMYLAIEDATIRAGKSSFCVEDLTGVKTNVATFQGAIEKFAKEMGLEGTSIVGEGSALTSGINVSTLIKNFSDALVADGPSRTMLCLGNRIHIGTGIGGHTSDGGHETVFQALKKAYVEGYTSQDETKAFLISYLTEKYPDLMDKLGYITELGETDDLARIVMMLKLAQSQGNAALQGIDLDAIEAAIRAKLLAYQSAHTLEEQAAAQAAAYDLMVDIQKLAAKVTAVDYKVTEDSYYVSLGDSNINGYGLEGYTAGTNGGFGQKLAIAAPGLVAQELFGTDWQKYYDQYAMGSLRSEDLLYLLGGENVVVDDYYTDEVEHRVLANFDDIEAAQKAYVAAVQKADLITIALGGGNVTTFTGEQIDRVTGNDAKPLVAMDWSKIGYTDAAIAELQLFIAEMVPLMDTLGLMNKYVPEGIEISNPAAFAATLLESMLYGYASYNYYYPQVIARIREINPDAQLVIIGMFNPIDDWTMEMAGEIVNIGGIVNNVMEMTNIQNLAYALMNDNTTYIDIHDTETILEATSETAPSFTAYYESILVGDGENAHASADGHKYMSAQILANLGGVNVDAEIGAIVEDFYNALNDNYLTTAEKLATIGKAYAALDEKGALNEYPVVKVVKELYVALSDKNLITDDHSLAIVIKVCEKLFDAKLDPAELREIVGYVYFTVFAIKQARGPALDLGIFTAGEKLDILETVYEVLVKNDYIDDSIPGVTAIVSLYNDIRDDEILDDAKIESLIGKVVETYVESEVLGAEEIQKVAADVVESIMTDDSIPVDKKIELLNKVVDTLDNIVGDGALGEVIPGIPSIPDVDLTIVNKIIDKLDAEGLLSKEKANEIVADLTSLLLDADYTTTDGLAKLADAAFDMILSKGFTAEQAAKIAYSVVEYLIKEGYVDDAIDTYVEPYYQIALKYVLTADNIVAAKHYINIAIEAVKDAIDAVNGYEITTPEYIKVKNALVAELKETLTTLEEAIAILEDEDSLKNLKEVMKTVLTLKDDLDRHVTNIAILANDLGIAGEYAIGQLMIIAQNYKTIANNHITNAYNWLVENVKGINQGYITLVENIGAIVDKFDIALGQAVRTFMYDAPADTVALISIYGENAIKELCSVAANAANDLYTAAANFALLLKDHGIAIYSAIVNDPTCKALQDELEMLNEQLKALAAAAAQAPAAQAVKIYESIEQLKAYGLELAGKFYDAAVAAVTVADPIVGNAFEKAIDALTDAAGIITSAASNYSEWLSGQAIELASKIVETFMENWNEFAGVAAPIICSKVQALLDALTDPETYETILDKIVEEAIKVAPQLKDKIYDYLYSNNPELAAFIERHEPYLLGLAERYGAEALGAIGVALATYGPKLGEYLIENADEILAGIVEFVEKNNVQIVAILQIYAEYIGICDQVSGEIGILSQKLTDLQAEITKQLNIINNEICPELAKLNEQLKAATEPAKAAIMQQIEVLNQKKQQLEQYIEQVKAAVVQICETIAQLNQKQQAVVDALSNLGSALKTLANVGVEEGIGGVLEALNIAAYAIRDLVNVLDGDLAGQIDVLIQKIKDYLDSAYNSAIVGDYNINVGSNYVAFGDNKAAAAVFAQLLKDEVTKNGVSYKYPDVKVFADSKITDLFAILSTEAGVNAVADADLISIGYSYDQIAEDTIYTLIDLLIFGEINGEVELPTAEDWNELVGTQIANEVLALLAEIKLELEVNGLNISIAPYLAQFDASFAELAKNGKTISEATMTALEYFAYNAVEYAVRVPQAIAMINQINPDALVMLNAISNPVSGWSVSYLGFELAFGDYLDYVVDAIYVESLALAAINDSVVFVPTTEIETSYTGMVINEETIWDWVDYILGAPRVEITPKDSAAAYIAEKMYEALNITVEKSVRLGDVDRNNSIDNRDLILFIQYALGDVVPGPDFEILAADLDGKDSVNNRDLILMWQYILGDITVFPAEENN